MNVSVDQPSAPWWITLRHDPAMVRFKVNQQEEDHNLKTGKKPTQYNLTEASRLAGISRSTLRRHISKGRLSCTEKTDGQKMIDASELARVYGDIDLSKGDKNTPTGNGNPILNYEVRTLEERLDTLAEERRREREILQDQIDHLKESLKLAQEGHNRATLLLEQSQSQPKSKKFFWRRA